MPHDGSPKRDDAPQAPAGRAENFKLDMDHRRNFRSLLVMILVGLHISSAVLYWISHI